MTMTQKEAQQHIFDLALNHIRKQGGPSISGSKCAYRGEGGRSCAFAPAIKEYDEMMEGRLAWVLLKMFPENMIPEAIIAGVALCQDVQFCHDNVADCDDRFMENFERNMKDVATTHSLIYTGGI